MVIVGALSSRIIISAVGTAYPAYRTFKALESPPAASTQHEESEMPADSLAVAPSPSRRSETDFWLRYWAVWAVLGACEFWSDVFLAFWVPFYYELKTALVLWAGASFV